jgi:hypothetical protein
MMRLFMKLIVCMYRVRDQVMCTTYLKSQSELGLLLFCRVAGRHDTTSHAVLAYISQILSKKQTHLSYVQVQN